MKRTVCFLLTLLLVCASAGRAGAENETGGFSSSGMYAEMCALIDQSYTGYTYAVRMDDPLNTFYFWLAMPLGDYISKDYTVGTLLDNWNAVVDTTRYVSETFRDSALSGGYDVNFVVVLVSDTDYERVLYVCMNGTPVYDIVSLYAFQ